MNTTLQNAIRNKVFNEKYYTSETKTAMKKLASKAYTDVSGTDNTSLMVAFNAYYNLLEDNTDPSAFNGTQSLTREQFSALVYKATTPVSQDYLVGFNGADDPFTVQVDGLTDYTDIAKQLDTYAFINAADGCLDGNIAIPI